MRCLLAALVFVFAGQHASHAYVDISPTLGWIVQDAESICVLQVEAVSVEKKAIVFKRTAILKGKVEQETMRHKVAEGNHPREPRIVVEWAEPGKTAIAFLQGKNAVICIGNYWYQAAELKDNWWTMTTGRPELSLAYFGSSERLRSGVEQMLAGKEAILTAVSHGSKAGVYQYQNIAFHEALRGKDCPVWRFRANLKMPESIWQMGAKDSPWIVGLGAAGSDDVPRLIKELEAAEGKTRSLAADDLGLIGLRARQALPMLHKDFDDADPNVRISAARAAVLIGDDDEATAMNVLLKSLKDESSRTRRSAAAALGDLGEEGRTAVPALIDALKDGDTSVRWAAAEALAQIGWYAQDAIPSLAEAMRDPALRVMAADALGHFGKASRGAVPLLLDGLKGDDLDFRWTCAVALSRIDIKAARAAVPLFAEKLRSPELRVRWDAAMYLAPMGFEAKDAAPDLREWAKKGNGVAAETLAKIAGPDAIDILPKLLAVLDDEWDTTAAIATIGPKAIPDLIAQLRDKKGNCRHLVVKALSLLEWQSPEVTPILHEAIGDEDAHVRRHAAMGLGNAKKHKEKAIAALSKAMNDPDARVRLEATASLSQFKGPGDVDIVKARLDLCADKSPEIRRDAALALAEAGEAAKGCVPTLQALTKDGDAGVRAAAAMALARRSAINANQKAVPLLMEAAQNGPTAVRAEAIRMLGTMGTDAERALPVLLDARLDDQEEVRLAAYEALSRVQRRR